MERNPVAIKNATAATAPTSSKARMARWYCLVCSGSIRIAVLQSPQTSRGSSGEFLIPFGFCSEFILIRFLVATAWR